MHNNTAGRRRFLGRAVASSAALAFAPTLVRAEPAAAEATEAAPSFRLLHSFSGPDGTAPQAGVVQLADGRIFGTTALGGSAGFGNAFRVNVSGGFATLHDFLNTSADGSTPVSELAVRDDLLFGTTLTGGAAGAGAVFRLSPGGDFQLLHSFAGGPTDGGFPSAGLADGGDGFLYGVTSAGGASNDGTLFRTGPNGPAQTLRSFSGARDGSAPTATLVRGVDGALYGSTLTGGPSGGGTIFRYVPGSGAFDVRFAFTGSGNSPSQTYGALLPLADGTLAGTSYFGGANGNGCIYLLRPSGELVLLHSFLGGSDGMNPASGLLIARDGRAYGTAHGGGKSGRGTLFRIDGNGSHSVVLRFSGVRGPRGALLLARDGAIVGTTESGGASGLGAIYRVVLG